MLQRVGIAVGGREVEGVLHLPESTTVGGAVVLHGSGGNIEYSAPLCAVLANAGVAALRFTMEDVRDPAAALAETAGAIRFLRAHPSIPQRAGVVGYSYGGVVAALAAGRDSRVKAAALIATPGDWTSWKPIAELSRTRAKVLIVRASDDRFVGAGEADRYAAVLTQARVTHRVVTIAGGHHFSEPGATDQMHNAVAAWMKECLA